MPINPRTTLLSLAAVAATSTVVAAPAEARSSIRVGIGDQSVAMFDSSHYQALDLKMTRFFFPWNGMDNPYELARATQFADRAKAEGVSVLFHLSTDDYRLKKGKLPSVSAYKKELKKIVPYFRDHGVHEWGVWNEANHASQPTYRNPKRAAQYFREMYRVVGHKEKIVALDVLDQGGVDRYEKSFFRALSPTYRKRVKYVGLHNYSDVNRKRTTYTSKMIHTARHYNRSTRFWFTETGGLVEFGKSFKCSTSRAASRTKSVFSLANKYKSMGVQRVYLYNWTGAGCGKTRFDAGLTAPDGTPRKAYYTFKAKLKHYSR